MSSSDALALDLQHVLLQQAVDGVNEAAGHVKKKKKKRSRESDATTNSGEAHPEEMRTKKKKKKHHASDEVEISQAEEQTEANSVAEGTQEAAEKARRKKEKKEKRKQEKEKAKQIAAQDLSQGASIEVDQSVHLQPQPSTSTDEDLVASNADFLSAVVAAASATSHMHAGPSNEFAHPMPPFTDPMMPFAPGPSDFTPIDPPAFGHGQPHPSMFPGLDGLNLPDMSLVSSDYLLQTLQNLDINQIASVLKSLGDHADIPSLNISPSFVPAPPPPGPPPVKQTSAKSVAILGRHPKQVKASGQSTRSLPPPTLPAPTVSPAEENPDHAHMLANVWMNAGKLAQMVKTHGLVYKKGKFSATEEAQISAAIENYKSAKGFSQDDLVDLIFSKEKGRGEAFWQEITSSVHLRPIIAVYHYVRRKYHPLHNLGKWMPSEDQSLRQAVTEYGQQWQKAAAVVGRNASDCRDRWRNHLENSGERKSGPWTKEEEQELAQIVTELKHLRGESSDNDIFWGAVSQRMGGRRGRQQCRIKWLDSLSSKFKNDGARPRWSQLDAYILVHKVASLDVRDDSEIDWNTLPDEDWNMWSAHSLQRRWLTMKRSVKGYENMTHDELMDILRTKKAQSPPPPAPSRSSKKQPRSAEIILDSEDEMTPPPQAELQATNA